MRIKKGIYYVNEMFFEFIIWLILYFLVGDNFMIFNDVNDILWF